MLGPTIELIRNILFDFLKIIEYFDSVSSVGIFARFYDPPGVFLVRFLES